jgi:hypothetical protein
MPLPIGAAEEAIERHCSAEATDLFAHAVGA